MKKGGTIYLFRHGQSTYNRDGKFTGFKNAKLTAKGRAQARMISRKLKNKKFQVAIHTSLSRSKDTLKIILREHPECRVVLQDDRIIERSYGILEGSTHESFIDRIGKQEYDLRIHGDAIESLGPKLRKKVERFLGEEEYKAIHRGWEIAVPDGESLADVEKRVREFIKDLKKLIRKNNCNVAIAAHGNSIRLFRKIMEKATIEETTKLVIPYDRVFEYKVC